jgi:hypothetical protein
MIDLVPDAIQFVADDVGFRETTGDAATTPTEALEQETLRTNVRLLRGQVLKYKNFNSVEIIFFSSNQSINKHFEWYHIFNNLLSTTVTLFSSHFLKTADRNNICKSKPFF